MRGLGVAPVAIGGVGGSGTRVVAQIVQSLGFHMGGDLNDALDNLWFTLLFRRPRLAQAPMAALQPGLNLFADAMRGEGSPQASELGFLREAQANTAAVMGELAPGRDWDGWAKRRAESLLRMAGPPSDARGWGWKEPCTHVFLDPLATALPGLRYIHVIRNGVDLAHSMLTQFQLALWGGSLGIEAPQGDRKPEPATLLRYWVRANRRAIEQGEALFRERFLLLRYESICRDPVAAVERVSEFLRVHLSPASVERLASVVRSAPPGRRRPAREASDFSPSDLAAVEAMGFRV